MPFNLQSLEWSALLSFREIITSLILVAGMLVARSILIRYVRKGSDVISKDQRRWIIRIKNTAVIVIVTGLILIWAPQLHTFAISIAAFAVALVVATKEMILCLVGAVMRAANQPFQVGEWVTVDGITGEVIDLDAFSFHLQEVDMEGKTYRFTGRTVSVPNSRLFTSIIENANFFKNYIFEDVRMAVQYTDIDPDEAMTYLREIAERHYTPYRDNAKAFNRAIRRRAGLDIETADPVYDLTTTDLGHYHFHVRLFLPTPLAYAVGSDVTQEFLSRIHKMRGDAVARKAADEEEALSGDANADKAAEEKNG